MCRAGARGQGRCEEMSWGRECKGRKDGGERAGGGTMLPPLLSPGTSGGSPPGGLSSLVTGGNPELRTSCWVVACYLLPGSFAPSSPFLHSEDGG